MTFYFRIEPLDGPPPAAGMFIVVWPEENGDGRYLQHAHPDRMVPNAMAGDMVVHQKRDRYRVLAVQRSNDWGEPWFTSVRECVGDNRLTAQSVGAAAGSLTSPVVEMRAWPKFAIDRSSHVPRWR